jgi:serine/threonine-protein kinase HipA
MCQLAGRPSRERGHGTAQECAAIVTRHATEPEVEVRRLFRLLLVAYWIGNGDLHLKNLSMLRGEDGAFRLAPAYDLICTRIYGEKTLTMSVGIKDKDLRRRDWLDFAVQHARIPREEAVAIIDHVLGHTAEALALLERSFLPESLRKDYGRVLRKRSRALA